MELVGFIIIFLICMGIAKAINKARGRLIVNGAGIFLVLATVFIAFIAYMASQSSLPSGQASYAFGRSIGPVLLVSAAALYYFFKFRTDKAHQTHLEKLRQQRNASET